MKYKRQFISDWLRENKNSFHTVLKSERKKRGKQSYMTI